MRIAVIGIGSNSLRMLIADLSKDKLTHSQRFREGLRVFAALDAQGNITSEMIQNACQSVSGFQQEALRQGAQSIHLFATSAVRDAHNQKAFATALECACGLSLEICSGEMEALLSFIGATKGEHTGIIDIGGGSTEIVVGQGAVMNLSASLQIGAVRLHKICLIDSVESAYRVVELTKEILLPHKQAFLDQNTERWVGVGGTFTTSAALIQRIPWDRRDKIHGFTLTQENITLAMKHLAPVPMSERLKLPYLQPQRADIVVHGIAILLGCMENLEIEKIVVSDHGNLEGYLKYKYLMNGKTY